MDIHESEIDGVLLVEPVGRIEVKNSYELKTWLSKRIDDGKTRVLIDMGKVEYMDSNGLGALLSAFKKLKTMGGAMAVTGIAGETSEIFRLTRMDRVFDIFDTREQALKNLGTQG